MAEPSQKGAYDQRANHGSQVPLKVQTETRNSQLNPQGDNRLECRTTLPNLPGVYQQLTRRGTPYLLSSDVCSVYIIDL